MLYQFRKYLLNPKEIFLDKDTLLLNNSENIKVEDLYKFNPFEKIDSDMDEEMLKDIYKKIAVKVHPDKKHGDEEKFKVLNRANKNKDYGAMLEMADELNLGKVFPINEYTYNELKKQIRAIIETIKKMQMTFAWQWKHIDKNQKPAYKDYILKQMEL